MKCQTVELLISAKIDGEVTASEWREAELHMANCEHCTEVYALFEQSNSFIQANVAQAEPARDLWAGIAPQLRTPVRGNWMQRKFAGIRDGWRDMLARHNAHWRPAVVGFAAASVLFIIVILGWRISFYPEDKVQYRTLAPGLTPLLQDFVDLPRERGLALYRQAAVAQEVQRYFTQAGLLLMEIKNSQAEGNQHMLDNMRATSRALLAETIVIKKELDGPELALVREVVEQIETALFDVANLQDDAGDDDFELIKASILRKDLLIKIEIIDLKKIAQPPAVIDNSVPATQNDLSEI